MTSLESLKSEVATKQRAISKREEIKQKMDKFGTNNVEIHLRVRNHSPPKIIANVSERGADDKVAVAKLINAGMEIQAYYPDANVTWLRWEADE